MDDAQRIQRSTRSSQLTTVIILLIAVMSLGLLSSLWPALERELIRSRIYEQAALLDFGQPRGELKAIRINGQDGFRQRFDRGTVVYQEDGRMLVLPHPAIPDRNQVQARVNLTPPHPAGVIFHMTIGDVW